MMESTSFDELLGQDALFQLNGTRFSLIHLWEFFFFFSRSLSHSFSLFLYALDSFRAVEPD